MRTAPLTGGALPSPSYRPRTSSRMFARASPSPRRTADESSLTDQLSPLATSNPEAAIRLRASTPAAYQLPPFDATQLLHPFMLISASTWKFGPRARSLHGWSYR